MSKIAVICGSFHEKDIIRMLSWAKEEAENHSLELDDPVWVPGSMEVPLALERVCKLADVDGAICLGIIEKGETQHGLAMGQAVIKSIVELQIKYDKPIGLGIIGPGAEIHHIEPRLEPHARAAVSAVAKML
jgi:6,7-dimethyl-8-ribityllumazine synthase